MGLIFIFGDTMNDIKFRVERPKSNWNLCSIKVFVTINDVEYKVSLTSGGYVSWDEEGDYIEYGPWSVYVPKEIMEYKEAIEKWVNENIEWGCCGGCI